LNSIVITPFNFSSYINQYPKTNTLTLYYPKKLIATTVIYDELKQIFVPIFPVETSFLNSIIYLPGNKVNFHLMIGAWFPDQTAAH